MEISEIRFEFFCKYHENGERHVESCAYIVSFADDEPSLEVHSRGNLTQGNRVFPVSDRKEFADAVKGWINKIGKQHERFLGYWQGNCVLVWGDNSRSTIPLTANT